MKPKLFVDLQGEDRNIYVIIHKAGQLIDSAPDFALMLTRVIKTLSDMEGRNEERALEIIKEYVEIIDIHSDSE